MIDLDEFDREVIRTVASRDEMFVNEEHYFGSGRSALEWIGLSLRAARRPPDEVGRILDLPCGHGRVMRYLRAAFPRAAITACDLLREGVDFCAETFGAEPLYSDEDPSKIVLERDAYDLVWVGSLLTHLDARRWPGFLKLFRACLRPGGLLVFTTCGRHSYDQSVRQKTLPPEVVYGYERGGFGYADYEGAAGYGNSLSSAAWVFGQVGRLDEMRVVLYSERAWDDNQDVFACAREPGWRVNHPRVSTAHHPAVASLRRIGRRLLKGRRG